MITTILLYLFIAYISAWLGNFITSFVCRMPANAVLSGRQSPPFCDNCNNLLPFPDYGPIYYYFFISKQCRFCGIPIPARYTVIELFFVGVGVSLFAILGLTQIFIASLIVFAALTLLSFIDLWNKTTTDYGLWFFVSVSVAYRLIVDSGEFTFSVMISLIIAIVLAEGMKRIYKMQIGEALPYYYYRFFLVLSLLLPPVELMVVAILYLAIIYVLLPKFRNGKYSPIVPLASVMTAIFMII